MKKIILFSMPSPEMHEKIKKDLFPPEFNQKIFGYIPSNGMDVNALKYINFWKDYVEENNAKFVVIDIAKRGEDAVKEIYKLNDVQ